MVGLGVVAEGEKMEQSSGVVVDILRNAFN